MKNIGMCLIKSILAKFYQRYQIVEKSKLHFLEKDLYDAVEELKKMKVNELYNKMKKK
jgi:hypothetical protein